jgi:uncharacterized protein YbjT (DUF2867 family)
MTQLRREGPITVIGATGQQGGAVLEALLSQGLTVRAVTRNSHAENSRALTARGIEVVSADLDDHDSVRAAFDGAAAAFAMATHDGPEGTEREIAHGRTIARAAGEAHLPHLVYSSVGGADRHSGIPHFESKRRIEEFLSEEVPVTLVRPTFFMETLRWMIRRDGNNTMLALPISKATPLQMISVRDIGRVAARLLAAADPDVPPVEIASDELTGEQIADRFTDRLGSPVTYVQVPLEVLGDDEDLKAMFRWLDQPPSFQADFARTRELAPDPEDLSRWLIRQPSLG